MILISVLPVVKIQSNTPKKKIMIKQTRFPVLLYFGVMQQLFSITLMRPNKVKRKNTTLDKTPKDETNSSKKK